MYKGWDIDLVRVRRRVLGIWIIHDVPKKPKKADFLEKQTFSACPCAGMKRSSATTLVPLEPHEISKLSLGKEGHSLETKTKRKKKRKRLVCS
jgi:hypothetical protein